jgi:aerobic-type carbon monoxide dehydrogenase small subunit (CoxS/CutS family)
MNVKINLTINGKSYSDEVEPRILLADYLREHVGLTGTHIGCKHESSHIFLYCF